MTQRTNEGMSRRGFLRTAVLGAGGLALGHAFGPWLGRTTAQAFEPGRRKVLVWILQRGGVDGISMVVPHGERAYYEARPDLAIARPGRPGGAVALEPGFGLHPAMAALEPAWRAGELAVVHAVGSPHPTRSHFEAQHHLETGVPGRTPDRHGWLNRTLQHLPEGTRLRAIAWATGVPEAMRGSVPVVATTGIGRVRTTGVGPGTRGRLRTATEALYADPTNPLARAHRGALRALDELRALARGAPASDVDYPGGALARQLREVARLVRADAGLEIALLSVGGWDTHIGQGAAEGGLARRLGNLADAIAAFRVDLGDRAEDVVVVTSSEFGRTVAQNGSGGTDHGHGTASLVWGGPVRGRRVCGRWPGLAPEQRYEGRDLEVTTDFRDLLSEVLVRHLGVAEPEAVFPGHVVRAGAFPGVLRQG